MKIIYEESIYIRNRGDMRKVSQGNMIDEQKNFYYREDLSINHSIFAQTFMPQEHFVFLINTLTTAFNHNILKLLEIEVCITTNGRKASSIWFRIEQSEEYCPLEKLSFLNNENCFRHSTRFYCVRILCPTIELIRSCKIKQSLNSTKHKEKYFYKNVIKINPQKKFAAKKKKLQKQ